MMANTLSQIHVPETKSHGKAIGGKEKDKPHGEINAQADH